MSTANTSNKWSLSTGFAFWGVTVQTVFSLIGTTLLLYIIYNVYDIFLSAFLPYEAFAKFGYFESVKQKCLDSSIVCFIIAALAYIFYLVGICMWKGAQRSIKSDIHVRDIIWAEFIMPAEVVIFYLIYYTSPELIENFDSVFPILMCGWVAYIVGAIILLVQFKSLSKEEAWSEKARKGADDLRLSYSLVLWIQGVLIVGFLIISLTVYSSISKFQSVGIDKYGNTISNTFSVAQEMQNLAAIIKLVMMFVCFFVFIFAVILTIYRIIGWYRIKVSGNEEVYQLASKQAIPAGPGRFCHKCGVQLPENSAFCPNCGSPVAVYDIVESSENQDNSLNSDTRIPDETVDSEQPSSISIMYEDEESDNKKKWMLWGGIVAAVFVVALAVWALLGRPDKMEANSNVFAEHSVIFKSVENGVGIGVIDEVKYGTPVECRPSELDKDGIWTKVAFEKEGKVIEGYMSKADVLNTNDYLCLAHAGMSELEIRNGLLSNVERLALLGAIKSVGENWQIEELNRYGQRQSNSKRLTVSGASPSEDCLGFILRNNETNERKFFLYSTPDLYSSNNTGEPVCLYSEPVIGDWDEVYDVTLKKRGRYEVVYMKTTEETYNGNSFVYEGSAMEEEPENEERKFTGTVEMSGLVDGEYPVKMELTMYPDHTVSGTVTYTKYNVPMGIKGTYSDRGDSYDFSLDETSEGKLTGNYIGRYDGLVFSGTWVKADGSKEMPFRVER